MKKSTSDTEYYSTDLLVSSSRRSYYQEKLLFFTNKLALYRSPTLRILDIGCNDGELTQLYGKYGKIIGIDINENAIKRCKEKKLQCMCIDLNELVQTHANYFDVVIAGDIIEHIFDTDTFLKNINKVLRKNGKLLLTTPNLVSFGRRIMMVLGKNPYIEYSTELPSKEYNVGHIRYYTAANLREQLIEQHFTDIEISGDVVNILPGLVIPYGIAKRFPTIARNFLVYAKKI